MTFSNFAYQIATATVTTLDADSVVGSEGTYNVRTREREFAQPDGGPRPIYEEECPLITVRCDTVNSTRLATMTWGVGFRLRISVYTTSANTVTAKDENEKIRDYAMSVIATKNGAADWLSGSNQVLIESWTATPAVQDAENPYLFMSSAECDVVVIYQEG